MAVRRSLPAGVTDGAGDAVLRVDGVVRGRERRCGRRRAPVRLRGRHCLLGVRRCRRGCAGSLPARAATGGDGEEERERDPDGGSMGRGFHGRTSPEQGRDALVAVSSAAVRSGPRVGPNSPLAPVRDGGPVSVALLEPRSQTCRAKRGGRALRRKFTHGDWSATSERISCKRVDLDHASAHRCRGSAGLGTHRSGSFQLRGGRGCLSARVGRGRRWMNAPGAAGSPFTSGSCPRGDGGPEGSTPRGQVDAASADERKYSSEASGESPPEADMSVAHEPLGRRFLSLGRLLVVGLGLTCLAASAACGSASSTGVTGGGLVGGSDGGGGGATVGGVDGGPVPRRMAVPPPPRTVEQAALPSTRTL